MKFLKECIKKTLDNGIGAKTKLGWGRAKDIKIKEFGAIDEYRQSKK